MGKLRSASGMAMIWLVTVAGVSATAWVAIDRAGREISDPGATSLAIPSLGSTSESATPSGGPTSTVATPAPSASRTTAAPATTRATAIPRSPTSPQGSTSPSPSGNSPYPGGSTTPIDRSVHVTGGQVSVRCTSAVITLRIAQPDNGWRVEVDGSGPVKVEVTFQQGDAEGGAQARVEAVCSTGTPVFTVDSSS
jgi:hypothetical protein